MTLRPSSTDRNHARKGGVVSEFSGVKSFDHEKGEYVEVQPEKDEPKIDVDLLKEQFATMSGKEIDEAMTEHFDKKIDRRKFRTDEAVRAEALRILDNFI